MTIWANEIKELDKLYLTFKGHIPDIVKEMEQLLRTDDANVVMLYSRRCLEVIVTDLCETELKRPRKTEPLKGIIDKLNSEEKVPSHIITSMHSLNSMATYGTHPKDFDPEQVKPVLNNLAIIIKWYLKYKDFQIVSKTEPLVEKKEIGQQETSAPASHKPGRSGLKKRFKLLLVGFLIVVVAFIIVRSLILSGKAMDYIIDSRDGEVYATVIIGNQVWMSENLRATRYNDGTPIPLVTADSVWRNLVTPGYCWYDNDEDTYRYPYGALYNWYAVNTGKLCPTGWHVPSDAECTTLTDFLGDESVAGDKLKIAGKTYWENPYDKSIKPTNETGFAALPGGSRGCSEALPSFDGQGYIGSWWSSSEDYNTSWDTDPDRFAWRRLLLYDRSRVVKDPTGGVFKSNGFSVRCVKD